MSSRLLTSAEATAHAKLWETANDATQALSTRDMNPEPEHRDHTWSLDDVEVVRAALRSWAAIAPNDRQRALDLCAIINAGFETVTKEVGS